MATPLRFRYSPDSWSAERVHDDIYQPLDGNIGAAAVEPRHEIGGPYETHRFEMANGDLALFARGEDEAFWLGNTETPEPLWRTDKIDWDEAPYHVARWAQRELLATLHETDPWLADYSYLSWFFLPVFMSKDGRESTRAFFREHSAGFPNAGRREATAFIEELLSTGILDDYRYVMAGKLGTSDHVDRVRMSAAMAEFVAAWLLSEAGYDIRPEASVSTGHSLDFKVTDEELTTLVEVTRPMRPSGRSASDPVTAVRETVETKVDGQLEKHGGGAVLFVDCSSFPADAWASVRRERPDVGHRPTVLYRARPDETVEAFTKGRVPLELDGVVDEWAD